MKKDKNNVATLPQPGSRILRTPEAALKLGLKPSTLEKWRCKGLGPQFIPLGGRAVGYYEHILDQWALAQMRQSTSEVK